MFLEKLTFLAKSALLKTFKYPNTNILLIGDSMKWLLNTLMSAAFFVISIAFALLVFNSFMTIAVAQSNHALDTAISESRGSGIAIDVTDEGNGFLIQTNDGAMELTKDGFGMSAIGI